MGGRSISNVNSRRIGVSQPACSVSLTTGSFTGRGWEITSCAPAGVCSSADASEDELRDAVGVALRRDELEAFGGELLAGIGEQRDDHAQRLGQCRLLGDRSDPHSRRGSRDQRRHEARERDCETMRAPACEPTAGTRVGSCVDGGPRDHRIETVA